MGQFEIFIQSTHILSWLSKTPKRIHTTSSKIPNFIHKFSSCSIKEYLLSHLLHNQTLGGRGLGVSTLCSRKKLFSLNFKKHLTTIFQKAAINLLSLELNISSYF